MQGQNIGSQGLSGQTGLSCQSGQTGLSGQTGSSDKPGQFSSSSQQQQSSKDRPIVQWFKNLKKNYYMIDLCNAMFNINFLKLRIKLIYETIPFYLHNSKTLLSIVS